MTVNPPFPAFFRFGNGYAAIETYERHGPHSTDSRRSKRPRSPLATCSMMASSTSRQGASGSLSRWPANRSANRNGDGPIGGGNIGRRLRVRAVIALVEDLQVSQCLLQDRGDGRCRDGAARLGGPGRFVGHH